MFFQFSLMFYIERLLGIKVLIFMLLNFHSVFHFHSMCFGSIFFFVDMPSVLMSTPLFCWKLSSLLVTLTHNCYLYNQNAETVMISLINVLSPVSSRCQSMVSKKARHVVRSLYHAAKCVLQDMLRVWNHAVAMSLSWI